MRPRRGDPPGFTAEHSVYRSGRGYRRGGPALEPQPQPAAAALQRYDVRWSRIFAAERQRIEAALGPLAAAVEHVGSSAVPGLWGRAEIDVLVGVRTAADVDPGTRLLGHLGYVTEDRAAPGSEPWSLLSRSGRIPFELLLVVYGGPLWRRHLWLREYLRRDPARALDYGRLKSAWAARYGAGTPGYKEAKRRFWAAVEGP